MIQYELDSNLPSAWWLIYPSEKWWSEFVNGVGMTSLFYEMEKITCLKLPTRWANMEIRGLGMDGLLGVAGMITSDDWDHARKFPAFSTSKINSICLTCFLDVSLYSAWFGCFCHCDFVHRLPKYVMSTSPSRGFNPMGFTTVFNWWISLTFTTLW